MSTENQYYGVAFDASTNRAAYRRSSETSSEFIRAFQETAKVIRAGAKGLTGRILPAFDLSLSKADKNFRTSWAPYRLKDGGIDPSGEDSPLSEWSVEVYMCSFVGSTGMDFVSPKTLKNWGVPGWEDARCPMTDIYRFCKREPNYESLIEKGSHPNPKFKFSAAVNRPDRVTLINVWARTHEDKKFHNAVLYMKSSAFNVLKETELDARTPYTAKAPRDKDWPDYLLGDVTHPETGLQFSPIPVTVGQGGFETDGITFFSGQRDEKNLSSCTDVMPVGVQELQGRILLPSSELIIARTYQEIVDLIVADGWLDIELVKKACGDFAYVPESPTRRRIHPKEQPVKHYVDEEDDEDEIPMRHDVTGRPVNNNDMFWVSSPEMPTVKMKAAEIQELVDNGRSNLRVCRVGDKKWMFAETAGFKAAPPPPPKYDVLPDDDVPPVDEDVPPDDDVPPADKEVSVSDKSSKSLSAKEEEELAGILRKIEAGTILSEQESDRMSKLILKRASK